MVVPRTPIAPRKQRPKDPERSQDKKGTHDNRGSHDKRQRQQEEQCRTEATVQNDVRNQRSPTVLSRSNSESGSNRMSISSDIEGPPSDPLCPTTLPDRTNADIREEDGEGDVAPSAGALNGNSETKRETEGTKLRGNSEAIPWKDAKNRQVEMDCNNTAIAVTTKDPMVPKGDAAAVLSYDRMKYTVDQHTHLELDLATELAKGRKDDDSDTETVYQSANEDEDPEYEEERTRIEREKRQEQRIEERKRREQQNTRREEVIKLIRQSKMASVTTCVEEPTSVKSRAPATRKFLNLFVNGNQYKSTGAESFGVFSCFLDGVEKQQSHRAVYRFVPRHADELYLETDDPVLMLSQSEDLWCQGYNMRSGSTGIFPTYYAARVSKEPNQGPHHMVRYPRHSRERVKVNEYGGECQGENARVLQLIQDFVRYFGFISKHPDQQRFACHVVMSDRTSLPLAESVGRAFQQYYAEHIGYSCPTEDIFID
ncbi:unnamed protein product [Merluccius merluccius]